MADDVIDFATAIKAPRAASAAPDSSPADTGSAGLLSRNVQVLASVMTVWVEKVGALEAARERDAAQIENLKVQIALLRHGQSDVE